MGIRFHLKVSKHLLGEILNSDGNQYLKGTLVVWGGTSM